MTGDDHRTWLAGMPPEQMAELSRRSTSAGLLDLEVTANGYAAFTRDYLSRRM